MVKFAVPALALCAGILAAQANADTVFTDLGTGDAVYQDDNGIVFEGASGQDGYHSVFAEFESGGDFALTQIDAGVTVETGTDTVVLSLWTDDGSNGGAQTQLGSSWTVTGVQTTTDENPLGNCCGLATVTGITGIDLAANTNYWLEVAPGGDDTYGIWNSSNSGSGLSYVGFATDHSTPDSEDSLPAFDVIGDSLDTPEPASLTLLGAGLMGIGLVRRRRKS